MWAYVTEACQAKEQAGKNSSLVPEQERQAEMPTSGIQAGTIANEVSIITQPRTLFLELAAESPHHKSPSGGRQCQATLAEI